LRACGEAVVSIERDQAGESDQTWDELWRRLQRHDEKFSILHSLVRGDDENTRAVIEEGMRAELSIAQRSRSQLNPRRLEGMLAAHGIRVELSAGSLPDFAAWLRGQRLQQQRAAARPDATHGPYDALLETVLGASNPTILVYVAEGPHSEQQLDGGVPAELALWLWALGHAPATRGVFLHVPAVVGDGILNLSGRNPRVHVSDSDEENLDVLEVAKTLLRDAQESPSGLESVSLKSVVANARLLLG
jgi:hypothetical protein